jgi:hypothetical protein
VELNPNHPTTKAVHDEWHTLAAVLMKKFGTDHVVVSLDDLKLLTPGSGIALQELDDGLHLRIVTAEQAAALAKKHGGLPT